MGQRQDGCFKLGMQPEAIVIVVAGGEKAASLHTPALWGNGRRRGWGVWALRGCLPSGVCSGVTPPSSMLHTRRPCIDAGACRCPG